MRRWVLASALAWLMGSSLSVAAEWPTYRGDVRRSGHSTEMWDGVSAESVWTFQSAQRPQPAWPGPARWDSWANVRGLGAMRNYDPCFHVVVAGGRLFFGSSADDSVHCLDAQSGHELWTFTTDGPVRIAPTIAGGRAYFGSDDGRAYCVDADDGALIWKTQPVDDSPQILNDGRFVSLSPCRTGVLVEGEHAYFGVGLLPWRDAHLIAVNARTGQVDGPECFVQKQVGLTMEGALLSGDAHLVAPAGRVPPYVFERQSGEFKGQLEGSGGSSVVLTNNGHLLCGPGNKTGWISETDVSTLKQTATHFKAVAAAVTPTRRVFVSRTRLSAVDAANNQTLWDVPCSHHFDVIVAGETIIAGGEDAVAAFSLNDGHPLWEVPVQGAAFGLAVAEGLLFVSTDAGVVHCFRPSGRSAELAVSQSELANDSSSDADQQSKPKAASPLERTEDKRGLVGHWLVHRGMAALARRRGLPQGDHRLSDLTGNAHALVHGPVHVREVGGVEALELDGETNSIVVSEDLERIAPPRAAMTAEAWVRIDEANSEGAIIGCFEKAKETDQGWLLGCHQSHFLFTLAAEEGETGATRITGKTRILPGHWYHVAATYDGATATLYVNGEMEGRSDAQHGPIDAPTTGFYEIGAYHDSDSYHPLYGMLHEARVYDRAVAAEEVARRHQEKQNSFVVPIELERGPVAQFVSPDSARIRWWTAEPVPTRLVLRNGHESERCGAPAATTGHEVLVTGLPHDRMLHYSIETAVGDEVSTTQEFELDTHFNFAKAATGKDVRPFAEDDSSAQFAAAARHILSESGQDQGICLVVGNGSGRLAWEILRNSRLRVIGVETDATEVEAARQAFLKAGVYGTRVAVHHVESYAKLPFIGRFANLIVSETLLTGGQPIGDAGELLRILRPNGGVICVGTGSDESDQTRRESLQEWFAATGLPTDFTDGPQGAWLTAVRPELEGAGEWSHLYGRADNSAFGGESLGGASTTSEMQVQWIGRPGPRAQPDRNGRKPSPLSTNGRLFVQGLHRVIAVDAFNGTPLWSLEIPALERFNMPRDCSNWCADDESVYLAVGDTCWQIDAASGEMAAFHPVHPAARDDWSYDWGYLAQVDDQLLGTAVKAGSAFTSYWGDADVGWYDALSGPATFKVCSDSLFAVAKDSGQLSWRYEQGVILNSTITVADGRICFVESRSPAIKQAQSRRVGEAELWDNQFLVTLDLQNGKTIWEQPIDTADGTVAFYLAAGDGTLVVNASTDETFEVTAFQATDGKQIWTQSFGWFENKGDHGKAISRPAIVGGRVYVRPKVLDLANGEILGIEMPKGKCGTYAATTNALVFRTTEITLWNKLSGSASSWDRMRPDCWLSTIPAAGMLLSPEGGGGCSCGSWMEMSVGFMPRSE